MTGAAKLAADATPVICALTVTSLFGSLQLEQGSSA